jgi:hypothetical protein
MVQRSKAYDKYKGVLGNPAGHLAIERGRQESAVAVGLVRASIESLTKLLRSADIPIKLRFGHCDSAPQQVKEEERP